MPYKDVLEYVDTFEPDTHCFDEDTGKDCWSYSRDLVAEIVLKALQEK